MLSEAWGLYKRHWKHLLLIAFVVYAGVAVIQALLALVLVDWLAGLIGVLISLIATFWLQAALVKAVEDVRDGRADLTLTETFARMWPRVGAVAVASILALLGIALGLILLVVPGLVLITWWVLIVPVIVLENASSADSFGRSRELVRGYGWNVFGVIVLTVLLLIAVSIVLSLILLGIGNDAVRNFISRILSGTLTAPFIACAWTLLYFRLRDVKVGVSAPAPELA